MVVFNSGATADERIAAFLTENGNSLPPIGPSLTKSRKKELSDLQAAIRAAHIEPAQKSSVGSEDSDSYAVGNISDDKEKEGVDVVTAQVSPTCVASVNSMGGFTRDPSFTGVMTHHICTSRDGDTAFESIDIDQSFRLSKSETMLTLTDTSSDIDKMAEAQPNDQATRCLKSYILEACAYWKVTLAQIICVIYILVLTFSHPPVGMKDPATGDIIDLNSPENTNNGVILINGSYREVVAIGGWQKFFLAMSRMSAFSMYPMFVIVFITKMKALQTFFSKTPLSMYISMINEGHDFHKHAGKYIAFDVWIHTFFHILRWASQGNLHLLWTTRTGLSGLVTVIATPLITFPMMYFKRTISYEIRKGLHYLFYIFAIAMCFHVPTSGIPNGGFIAPVLGSCIVLYTLDAAYVFLFMTEKIETTRFYVLSSGVRISMPVSKHFLNRASSRASFGYLNIPWINDKQWHPFSLFQDPKDPCTQQMFLMKAGDWTRAVHAALSRDTTRPCWIQGPFPSPYSHAANYDNQILVASGIGITPALSAINAFKSSRRVNLIWVVRDAEMLEFFMEHYLCFSDGWNLIFYTGRSPLSSAIEEIDTKRTNVRIVKGRPDFSSLIPNVIYGVESKKGLPEKYTLQSKVEMKQLIVRRCTELDLDKSVKASVKISKLSQYGNDLGYSFCGLLGEIDIENGPRRVADKRPLDSCPELSITQADATIDHFDRDLEDTNDSSHWNNLIDGVGKTDFNAMMKPVFQPWEKNASQERNVRKLDRKILKTWGVMYCGGSKPVIAALRELSQDYNIDLHIDSFKW